MLLPDKHIKLAESIIGLSSFILEELREPKSIDDLWIAYQKINNTELFPAYHNFENLTLSIDFLFLIGAIEEDSTGNLIICD